MQSVVRASESAKVTGRNLADQRKEFDRFRQALANLPDSNRLTTEYAQLQRQFRDLQNFQLDRAQLNQLGEIAKALQAFRDEGREPQTLRRTVSELQNIRNSLAHASANVPGVDTVIPAYSLDDWDTDG